MSKKLFNLEDKFYHTYIVVAEDFTQAIQKFNYFANRSNSLNSRMIIVGDLKSISISNEKLIDTDNFEAPELLADCTAEAALADLKKGGSR